MHMETKSILLSSLFLSKFSHFLISLTNFARICWQNELEDELSRVHRDRRELLCEVCRHRKVTYLSTRPEEAVRQHFVFDSNSQIVYCAMEKVGSTFWQKLFQVRQKICQIYKKSLSPIHFVKIRISNFLGNEFLVKMYII